MRILWLFLFISSAFAECKPVSEPLKLTPHKGLIVKLGETPFHLQGLTFLTSADYNQAVTWLGELETASHGALKGLNRYGAETATLFHDDAPIAASFLRVGIAIKSEGGECDDALKQAEIEAIKAKAGLWAHVLDPSNPRLNEHVGRFTLVRGIILSARKARSGVFINFSRDFKTSLSGYIYERDVDKIDWQSLNGRSVILKGVITKNPNLQMAISDKAQIIVE
jgi:hypothetical protein